MTQTTESEPLPLIKMERISKVFSTGGSETRALSDIDIQVAGGEFIAICGPSGCGKSTLLSLMGLLDSPTSGQYRFDGQSVADFSMVQRCAFRNAKTGFVFQNFNLIADLTVQKNVELPMAYRMVPPAERRELAAESLEWVGMSDRASYFPSQLSGGQQQRVALARALVGKPKMLLADEPTGNLDSKNGHEVMELINRLHAGGMTVCMVTHDPRYLSYAQRSIELLDGRINTEQALAS